jgi:hypothetical protein
MDYFNDYKNNGYVLINDFISTEEAELLNQHYSKLRSFQPIFKTILKYYSEDGYRLQAIIKPSFKIVNLQTRIIKFVKENFPDNYQQWTAENFVALKSLPGGVEQQVHKDFPDFELCQGVVEPGGVLFSLQDNTKFVVYKTNGGVIMSSRRELILNTGVIVIFSGDLAHSGASYQLENTRLHCQLLVKGQTYLNDSTEMVSVKKYYCRHNNNHIYLKNMDRLNHERVCDRNPDRKALNEKRKKLNICSKECCGKTFTKVNTYQKHFRSKDAHW